MEMLETRKISEGAIPNVQMGHTVLTRVQTESNIRLQQPSNKVQRSSDNIDADQPTGHECNKELPTSTARAGHSDLTSAHGFGPYMSLRP